MTARQTPDGLTAALPLLACPHCSAALGPTEPGTVGCGNGHRFDIARQGYVSLLSSRARTDTADTADMVAARMAFLGAGHYRPIAAAVAELSGQGPALEIGAGTGYYLAAVLDRWHAQTPTGPTDRGTTASVLPESGTTQSGTTESGPTGSRPGSLGSTGHGNDIPAVTGPGIAESAGPVIGLAIDSSRFAAGRAAAAHPGIGSVVADAWSRLPVRDAVARTVLNIFAPRDAAEVSRVLAPDGRVVIVTPEPDHLVEIRGTLGMLTVDAGKPERLAAAFQRRLAVADRRSVRASMTLTRPDLSALVRMGPSARHIGPAALATAIDVLDELTSVTLSVTVSVFRADHQR